MNQAKIQQLKKLGEQVRTGGKGSVRRKHKAAHRQTSGDSPQFQQTLKRLGVQAIPGFEEVNIFFADQSVMHFVNPKVQASIQSHTFVIQGPAQKKTVAELLPGILPHLDSSTFAQELQGLGAGGAPGAGGDDMPSLVDAVDFEAVANKDGGSAGTDDMPELVEAK